MSVRTPGQTQQNAPPDAKAPLVAISLGDPGGIGPEVIVKALADDALRASARWVICGCAAPIVRAAHAAGVEMDGHVVDDENDLRPSHAPVRAGDVVILEPAPGPPMWPKVANAPAGAASFAFVERAIALAKLDESSPWRAHAVCTGPISKEAWSLAGHGEFPGHTELFADRFGVTDFAMMFHSPPLVLGSGAMPVALDGHVSPCGLNVILATTHMPLRRVPEAITSERVARVIALGHEAMQRLGTARPRIGVCGLNPHAGEHGLLGEEDDRVIAPAIEAARARGIDATGPHPADTIFQSALAMPDAPPAHFDLVVAMYHDQGLIPLKTLAWDRAVNMTVGLPIVRTSPDHGTAFDIAGKNVANAGSMRAAMRLAVRSAKRG